MSKNSLLNSIRQKGVFMVEIQTVDIKNHRFVYISMHLPKVSINTIFCTKGILATSYYNAKVFQEKTDAVILISEGFDLKSMLEKEILDCTKNAKEKGIYIGMKGEEALLKLVEDEN